MFASSHALVVGIDHYDGVVGSRIPPLRTAVHDAVAVADVLREQHHYRVTSLLDDAATKEAILAGLRRSDLSPASADDRMVVYFAGHGIAFADDVEPSGYLVPYGATADDRESFLSMKAVRAALEELECRHVLVILDCCFAGAFRWVATRNLVVEPPVLTQEGYERFTRDRAWQVLTSASHDQRALDVLGGNSLGTREAADGEDSQTEHSPFATALLAGLQGDADVPRAGGRGDGVITATELYLYVRDAVEPQTIAAFNRQTPGLWPLPKHEKGEYVFAVPNADPELPSAPELNRKSNPYRGLSAYDEAHAELFFGRDREVARLVEMVSSERLVAVVGPSGVGKTSLVQAGLVRALRGRGDFDVLPPIRPDHAPQEALANSLRHTDAESSPKRLLIVDPLEELATLASEAEREAFHAVLDTSLAEDPSLHVVVIVRSDHLSLLEHPTLAERLGSDRTRSLMVVPPMKHDALRRAIEGPAEVRVLFFEPPGLVDRLISDVLQMPGALPMLSFALSSLYSKYLARGAGDRTLTESDYEEFGGALGALEQRINQLYGGLESDAHRHTMRRLMLRMVTLRGGELARKPVAPSELRHADDEESARVDAVVQRLTDEGLVVTGDGIEPAHDTLLLRWRRLRDWVSSGDDELLVWHRLGQAAREWVARDRARELLWDRDPRLALVERLRRRDPHRLNEVETSFVTASVKRLWWRRLVLAAAILTALAVVIGFVLAIEQERERADEEERLKNEQRERAEEERERADEEKRLKDEQRTIATARQRAIQARTTLEHSPAFVEQAARRAIAAAESHPSLETDGALRSILALLPRLDHGLETSCSVDQFALSPDERYLAIAGFVMEASHDRLCIIDLERRERLQMLDPGDFDLGELAFDPRGEVLAAHVHQFGGPGGLRLWRTSDWEDVEDWIIDPRVESVGFDPAGEFLVAGTSSGTALVRNLEQRAVTVIPHASDEHASQSVELVLASPDGVYLATASDERLRVWRDWTSNAPDLVHEVPLGDRGLSEPAVVFRSDGRSLIVATEHDVRIIEIPSGAQVHSLTIADVETLHLSDDGATLTLDTRSGDMERWSLDPPAKAMHYPAPPGFDPEGILAVTDRHIVTAHRQKGMTASVGLVRDVATGRVITRLFHQKRVRLAHGLGPGAELLTVGNDHQVRWWGDTRPRVVSTPGTSKYAAPLFSSSPDDEYVAIAKSSTLEIRSVERDERLASTRLGGTPRALGFSDDGRDLVVATSRALVHWARWHEDGSTPETIREFQPRQLKVATFDHSGATLALALADRSVEIIGGSTDGPLRAPPVVIRPDRLPRQCRTGARDLALDHSGTRLVIATSRGACLVEFAPEQPEPIQSIRLLPKASWPGHAAFGTSAGALWLSSSIKPPKTYLNPINALEFHDLTGQREPVVQILTGEGLPVELCYSDEADLLATVSGPVAEVWRAPGPGEDDLELVLQIPSDEYIWSCAFSHDGRHLYAATARNIAIVPVRTDDLVTMARTRLEALPVPETDPAP